MPPLAAAITLAGGLMILSPLGTYAYGVEVLLEDMDSTLPTLPERKANAACPWRCWVATGGGAVLHL